MHSLVDLNEYITITLVLSFLAIIKYLSLLFPCVIIIQQEEVLSCKYIINDNII